MRSCECEDRLFSIPNKHNSGSLLCEKSDDVGLCGDRILKFVDEQKRIAGTETRRNNGVFVKNAAGKIQDIIMIQDAFSPVECFINKQGVRGELSFRWAPKLSRK